MDQKNTIVKCAMHDCLFNHNGTCDQYVINIGGGKCLSYVATGLEIIERKTCHWDCIHFDDSDPLIGPICLFKHPEPLKEFYDGMPCEYYHKKKNIIKIKALPREDQEIMNDIGYVPPKMSDHLCDIRCVSAHYAEDERLYCTLIHNYPERPLRCSAYDDGGEE